MLTKSRFCETVNFVIVRVIFSYNSIETFHLIIVVNPSKIITYLAHDNVLLKMFLSVVTWTHDDCFLIFFVNPYMYIFCNYFLFYTNHQMIFLYIYKCCLIVSEHWWFYFLVLVKIDISYVPCSLNLWQLLPLNFSSVVGRNCRMFNNISLNLYM